MVEQAASRLLIVLTLVAGPGLVRPAGAAAPAVAGFTPHSAIPPGSAGVLARLLFRVAEPLPPARDSSSVHIGWADDDVQSFETADGVFTRLACVPAGSSTPTAASTRPPG